MSHLEVVHIGRVSALRLARPARLRRLFTADEWAYCLAHRHADQHLAARLAAKRAARALLGPLPFARLEVHRDERGAPHLRCDGQPAPLWLSLSHDGDLAAAVVARRAR